MRCWRTCSAGCSRRGSPRSRSSRRDGGSWGWSRWRTSGSSRWLLLLPDLLHEGIAADDALQTLRAGQADPEGRARAARALAHAHFAAVQLDEALREVEAETQPILHALGKTLDLRFDVEDERRGLGLDHGTRIPNLDLDVVVAEPGGEGDAPLRRREADAVLEEVQDRLTDLGPGQVLIRDLLVQLELELDLLPRGHVAHLLDRRARDVVHVVHPEIQEEAPRLQPGEVQHVVHQIEEAQRLASHPRRELAPHRGGHALV